MSEFILNERLEQDSFFVANLTLCQVRLINAQDFVWFILVPRMNDIVHITDLSVFNQHLLMQEINQVANILQKTFKPTRLNIAAIGNIVSQMHWHIVVRYDTDKAWPAPVWGRSLSAYSEIEKNHIITLFNNELFKTTNDYS